MPRQYHSELAMLNRVIADRSVEYRSASWLLSNFNASVWEIEIDNVATTIDFRIRFSDDSLLTAKRHALLLDTFKCWLCVQDHFDTCNRTIPDPLSMLRRVQRTLHLIDYMLRNAETLGITKHGFDLLTSNDLKNIIVRLTQSSRIATSIYDWPRVLACFLREKSKELTEHEIAETIRELPAIATPFDDEGLTDLAGQALLKARIWLWRNDFYKAALEHLAYEWGPRTVDLSKVLYANTLRGVTTSKPVPRELLISPADMGKVELVRAPVRTQDDDRMSKEQLNPYKGALGRLAYLADVGLPIPLSALDALDDKSLLSNLKVQGRFRTLPQSVVFSAMRHAIEFAIEYGRPLIEAYLELARAWVKSNKEGSFGFFATNADIRQYLPENLRQLGVDRPRWPPKFPRVWPLQTPPPELIGNGE